MSSSPFHVGRQISQQVAPAIWVWDCALRGAVSNSHVPRARSTCVWGFDEDVNRFIHVVRRMRGTWKAKLVQGLDGFMTSGVGRRSPSHCLREAEGPSEVDVEFLLRAATLNGKEISTSEAAFAFRAWLCQQKLRAQIADMVEARRSYDHVDAQMLEPYLTQLNCGEQVAPEELRGIVKFLQAAELEATKGFNLNALSFAVSIWYCDLTGTWARSLQSDALWLGAHLKGLQEALRPLGGIASRGTWWLQHRHRHSSAPGRCRTAIGNPEDVEAEGPSGSTPPSEPSELRFALEGAAAPSEEQLLQLDDLVEEDPVIVPVPLGELGLDTSDEETSCSSRASSEECHPRPTRVRTPHSSLPVDLLLSDDDRGRYLLSRVFSRTTTTILAGSSIQ